MEMGMDLLYNKIALLLFVCCKRIIDLDVYV